MTTAQAYREVCTALSEATIKRAMMSMETSDFSVPRKLWILLAYRYGIEDSKTYNALVWSLLQAQPTIQVFLSRLYWMARVECRLNNEIEMRDLAGSLINQFGFEESFTVGMLKDMYCKIRDACYTSHVLKHIDQLYSALDLCHMLREHFVSPYGIQLAQRASSILKETMSQLDDVLKDALSVHLQTQLMPEDNAANEDIEDTEEMDVLLTTPPQQPQHIHIDIQDFLEDPTQAQALWQSFYDAFNQQHDPANQPPPPEN